MRRLSEPQQRVLNRLAKMDSFCPGLSDDPMLPDVRRILDDLVKNKRVTVTDTQDGPSYSLSAIGRQEVER